MKTKKNILWINYVKAICIITVYFVHCTNYYSFYLGNLNKYLETFYVNGFFFISGYLFFKKQLSEQIINRNIKEFITVDGKYLLTNLVHRIIIPSTIFATIEFIPSCIIKGREITADLLLYKTIGGGTYWFTSALIISELIIFILLFTRSRNILFYILASFVITLGGMFISNNNINIFDNYPLFPWCYKSGMLATIFLSLGGVFWKFESYINKLMNKVILLMLFLIYLFIMNSYSDTAMVLISLQQLNFSGIMISILSIIILIYIIRYFMVKRWSILEYIGQNTIGFYFLSGAIPFILSIIFKQTLLIYSFVGLLLIFFFSLTLSYIFVFIVNKYFPFLFDLRKFNTKKCN